MLRLACFVLLLLPYVAGQCFDISNEVIDVIDAFGEDDDTLSSIYPLSVTLASSAVDYTYNYLNGGELYMYSAGNYLNCQMKKTAPYTNGYVAQGGFCGDDCNYGTLISDYAFAAYLADAGECETFSIEGTTTITSGSYAHRSGVVAVDGGDEVFVSIQSIFNSYYDRAIFQVIVTDDVGANATGTASLSYDTHRVYAPDATWFRYFVFFPISPTADVPIPVNSVSSYKDSIEQIIKTINPLDDCSVSGAVNPNYAGLPILLIASCCAMGGMIYGYWVTGI